MSEETPWIIDVDARSFETAVLVRSRTVPVLLDFWAAWCGPCQTLGPALEKRAREGNGRFLLAKVDLDSNQELAQALRVQAVPTVLVVSQGQLVDGFQGALPEAELDAFLDRIAPGEGASESGEIARARELLEAGEFDAAIELFRAHLRQAPDDVAVRLLCVKALLDAGRPADARRVFDKLGETDRSSEEARALAKRLAFADQAGNIAELEAQVQAAPEDLARRIALGRAYIAETNYERGLEALLGVVRDGAASASPEVKKARQAMLETFEILGLEDPVANDYRFKLSLELFS